MSLVLGLDAKLYWDDEASYASPTWNIIDNAMAVTLNLETAEADVTTRGSGGWRATVATLKDASVDFSMLWDTADTAFAAIKDAYLSKGAINIAAMDGPIATSGSQGLRAPMMVTKFTRNEPLDGPVTVDVTVKPTYDTFDTPEWLVVGS